MIVVPAPGQNLIDIAMQYYGCYEGVALIMQDNDIALDDIISNELEILIRDEVPELRPGNLQAVSYYKEKGLTVNSGTYSLDGLTDTGDFTDEFTNEFY